MHVPRTGGSRMAALTLAAALAGLGCAVGPDYVPPEAPAPDMWQQQLSRGLAEGEADLQTWWKWENGPR